MKSIFTALALGLILMSSAQAQYPGYPPPGYYPPTYPGFGPGGVLQGQAAVLQAQGQASIDMESARVERQKALQAKEDTKKKAFDEMMYEKANTPSYTEEMEKNDAMLLRRIMLKPSDTEVTSGKAENIMLPYLRSLQDQGVQGPTVKLDPALVKEMNVTGTGRNSLGPLKNGGVLDWPPVLESKEQAKLAALLPQACSQAIRKKVEFKTLSQIKNSFKIVQDELRQKYRLEQIDTPDYLAGKRFLEPLEGAIAGLGQAGAGKYLDGTYTAKGDTVQELVDHMTSNGLKFGPATEGTENAYYAMHSAMVSYANSAQNGSGFQVRLAPPAYTDKYAKYRK